MKNGLWFLAIIVPFIYQYGIQLSFLNGLKLTYLALMGSHWARPECTNLEKVGNGDNCQQRHCDNLNGLKCYAELNVKKQCNDAKCKGKSKQFQKRAKVKLLFRHMPLTWK